MASTEMEPLWDQTKSKYIRFRCTARDKENMREAAEAQGMSISQYLTRLHHRAMGHSPAAPDPAPIEQWHAARRAATECEGSTVVEEFVEVFAAHGASEAQQQKAREMIADMVEREAREASERALLREAHEEELESFRRRWEARFGEAAPPKAVGQE